MKKIILGLALMVGAANISMAQNGSGNNAQREQKIQALYIAFISRELKLTELEAQKFWPVHTEFDTEMKALRSENDFIKREEAMLNVRKKYQDRFSKIIGAERTNNFYRVDMEFRKKMVEKLQQLRQQRQGNKVTGW